MRVPTYSDLRKKWIQWMLDFAQRDLNSLLSLEKKRLSAEIAFFCSKRLVEDGWIGFEQFEQDLSLLTSEEYNYVTEVDNTGKLINLIKLQKSAFEFLEDLNNIHNPRSTDIPLRVFVTGPLPEMSSDIFTFSQGTFEIKRTPKTPNAENWLILNFVSLIEKFDTYPIRKCKGKSKEGECGRYFLNLNRRKKEYCSNSCASRSGQTEIRDRLRKEGKWKRHLKKMRKYQYDRYEKGMKEKYGSNVKVSRRRRKTKKD